MYFQPEIETMPRAELQALQLERLRESLRNAYENVPLYRERFDAAGVTPDDLESLEDLTRFPFVVKQDMRDNYPFGMFARENADVARIHASSGTTGQATVVGHTAADLENWGDCFARGIAMVGGSRESTIQVSYGYGLFTGGLGAHAGGEAMGCTVIPTSSGTTTRQVQMLKDCKTDILCCTPSYALLIADTAIEMGYDPATEFQISGGIFGA
ncbi:MAG: phenylacetate--CoA ligase, partial [Enterorhabdus sp.]|nr:phenylacetate--CoA ligase [Enterorhabdus sp.]